MSPSPMSWPRLKGFLQWMLGFLFLVGGMWLLLRALSGYSLEEIVRQVRATPDGALLVGALLIGLSYAALYGYDALALRWLRHPLAAHRIFQGSFLASAFAATLGFPALTGGAVRLRYYSAWGLRGGEIARLLAATYVTAWLGYMAASGLPFVLSPAALPGERALSAWAVRGLGLALLAPIVVYLLFSRRHHTPVRLRGHELFFPEPAVAAGQVLVGFAKWTLGGLAFFALLPGSNAPPVLAFLTAYFLAHLAAILTHAPGGLGVFDATILLLMKGSIPLPELAGALLLWRGLYNVLPLLVSLPVLAWAELGRKGVR